MNTPKHSVDVGGHRMAYVDRGHGRRTFLRIKRYMLETGEQVRRIDPRTFEIVRTGERLTRVEDQ